MPKPRRFLSLAFPVVLLLIAAHSAHAGGPGLAVTVDPAVALCDSFLGFGAEWDSYSYPSAHYTDNDYARVNRRVEWMHLPVARVMMQCAYCYTGGASYDWSSREMLALCRVLDECQRLGTTVILTDWGIEPEWLNIPGVAKVEDPKYAIIIGAYLDYLINTKGYTCIRFLVVNNEPNLEVKDWTRWNQAVKNVAAELHNRGLDSRVRLMGPDESTDESWLNLAASTLHDKLGAYDIHRYTYDDVVRDGILYMAFQGIWASGLASDPYAAHKPRVISEAGITVAGTGSGTNPASTDYSYGLMIADYAVQAVSAGSWSVLAWMLDDNSIDGFTWGMLADRSGGFKLKPWFYPWSLLCRVFRPGSRIAGVSLASNSQRVLAAHYESAAQPDSESWSFCLVNRADNTVSLNLKLPGTQSLTLARYLYSPDSAAADSEGFPVPVDTRSYDLGNGAEIICPARSVTILTSASLSGDIDHDGRLGLKDVLRLIMDLVSGHSDHSRDFNADGKADIRDALALARYVLTNGRSGLL